jgi:hypothetical protein
MAFKSISEIRASSGSKTRVNYSLNTQDITISTQKSGKGKYKLCISIPIKISKQARLMSGDRVDIAFDQESVPPRCLIKRITAGGLALTQNKKNANRLRVVVDWVKGIPSVDTVYKCDSVVTDEGVLFDIPIQASFETCLRTNNPGLVSQHGVQNDAN